MSTMNVPYERLSGWLSKVFARLGLAPEDARFGAEAILAADLLGFDTHGIRKIGNHVSRLAEGKLDPKAAFRVVSETPVSAVCDGGKGLGFPAATRAMRLAISKAKASGVGITVLRNTSTFGSCSVYCTMALKEGMIGLCATNAAGKSVVPVGGTAPLFSTNPFGISIPAGKERGLLLDGATSVTAWTRVMDHQWFKKPLPAGWCVDEKGMATVDPEKAKALLPLGSTIELGAAKGWGLVLAVEALTGVLANGVMNGGDVPPSEKGRGTLSAAQIFAAIRVDLFRPLEEFKADMDSLLRYAHSSPGAEGARPVRVPGEWELASEEIRRKEGIPLDDKAQANIKKIAEKHGVAWEG